MIDLVCIGCPRGCRLKVDPETLAVTGNSCEKGEIYARNEVTDPRRTLTSTVRIEGAAIRRCPVRSREALPKDRVQEVAKMLDGVLLTAPVRIGDVVLADVYGTDIVAARDLDRIC